MAGAVQTGGYAAHGAGDGAQPRRARQPASAVDIRKHVALPLLFFSREGTPKSSWTLC